MSCCASQVSSRGVPPARWIAALRGAAHTCSISATAAVLPVGMASASDQVAADSILAAAEAASILVGSGSASPTTAGPTQNLGSHSAKIRCESFRCCHRFKSAVLRARDKKEVDQPDDAGLAQPGQFREHLAGKRRLIEAHDQYLHWSDHVITRARSS
jgi:hypothetical protein